ncbi:SDR family NAD(P)-dependent oxidoreductase [Endozoicomonas euniceicola]|uniref:SDR family NAD(P)-dependent oxidoreductase n=1 Tax=Endozoicomonas euniceicola TaxID=1234143 RepID=A0ABY6GQF5_9GAMM|nr:SDR family NAD(P)-dependent oxidoreductase [Endozoicomonas euniceicola]UYM14977.1 SDR family NAD(P)-dependent oxidoreductase [Endozoicomonas euniceicola]
MKMRFWLLGLLLLGSFLQSGVTTKVTPKVAPKVAPKVVVVTGASSGIGKSLVEKLAISEGYRVYGTTRQSDLVGDYKGYSLVKMDPGNTESVDAAIKMIGDRESGVDVLVNSASYLVVGSVESVEPDQLLDMFNVNVVGYARVTRAVLPYMRKHQSGLIVNISSSQAFEPRGLMESYSASRSAIEAMSLGQSSYLEDYGVRVVVFEPGATNTGIGKSAVIGSATVRGDSAGAQTGSLKRMMVDRLAQGASPEIVARRIINVIGDEMPDFRIPVDSKVFERARFVYRNPDGNGLREKLRRNYLNFLKIWGQAQISLKATSG